MYADDTVISFSDKSAKAIEEVINHEANFAGKWFTDNNLIMNLEKGETEFVRYGTRLKLLQRIRPNITPHVAEKIYSAVTRPILLCCYPVYISFGDTTKSKLQSIQDMTQKIVARDGSKSLKWNSLQRTRKKRFFFDISSQSMEYARKC